MRESSMQFQRKEDSTVTCIYEGEFSDFKITLESALDNEKDT